MLVADAELIRLLNHPIVDLGPYHAHGPFLNEGVEIARRALVDDADYARVHGGLLASTRARIAAAARCDDHVAGHPSSVLAQRRNPSWDLMCRYCEDFDAVDVIKRSNLLWLLYRLAFFGVAIALSERWLSWASKDERPYILCIVGLCRYSLSVDGGADLDTSPFAGAYAEAVPGSWASIEASYFLGQINARTAGEVQPLAFWLSRHKQAIEAADLDDHALAKLWSRYFRLHALLPQFEGRPDAMVRDMDEAEHWLGRMGQATIEQRAEYRALRYACYESRIKEALVTGDLALAEARARRAIACEPGDGRLFLHLGQVLIEKEDFSEAAHAYGKSILLTPWGAEVGLFMMGQCYEAMEEHWPALHCYRGSLIADPLSVSAREAAVRLAGRLGVPGGESSEPAVMQVPAGVLDHMAAKPHQRYAGMLGG